MKIKRKTKPLATRREIKEFKEKFGMDLLEIRKTMKRLHDGNTLVSRDGNTTWDMGSF